MNHELQPNLQLAETGQVPDYESRTFMQNILSRSRAATVLGLSAVALIGLPKTEQAHAVGPVADWPPITMTPEDPNFNESIAADCRSGSAMPTEVITKPWSVMGPYNLRFQKGSRRNVILHHDLIDVAYCDGYGQRTAITYLASRNKGQTRYVKGPSIIDRTNKGADNLVRRFGLGQGCRNGMIARYITVSSYRDYTGKAYRHVWRSEAKRIKCPPVTS